MKPGDRRLRLHKRTLRELTSDLSGEVKGGDDPNVFTLFTCYTCKTCQIGGSCATCQSCGGDPTYCC